MRMRFIALLAQSLLLLGCGGGGPSTPPTTPTINSVSPTGEIGFVTDAITFTADITGAVTEYRWTFDGGFSLASSTDASPTGTLDVVGSFDGTLVACDGADCSAPLAFSFSVVPDAPPTITGLLPTRTTMPAGSLIALEALTTGLPWSFDWHFWTPGGTEVSLPFTDIHDSKLPRMHLTKEGEYRVEVVAENRHGRSEPFEAAFTVTAPLAEFHSISNPTFESATRPVKAFGYGDEIGVIWDSSALGALQISSTVTPATAGDFVDVPLPAGMKRVQDAILAESHLVVVGNTNSGECLVAIAQQSFPAIPSTWETYTLPITRLGLQLVGSASTLALVPEASDVDEDPDQMALARNPLPRQASEWIHATLPEVPLYLNPDPPPPAQAFESRLPALGYRSTIHEAHLLIFALVRTKCCDTQNDLTRKVVCNTLPLSADPGISANWQLGTVLESEPSKIVTSMPFIGRTPDGKLTLPICRGSQMHVATPMVSRPLTPGDWEFTPPLSNDGFFPMPQARWDLQLESLKADYRLAYVEDQTGRQCFVTAGRQKNGWFRLYSVRNTPSSPESVLITDMQTSWLSSISPMSIITWENTELLDASVIDGRIRVVYSDLWSQAEIGFWSAHVNQLRITYLDWPTP